MRQSLKADKEVPQSGLALFLLEKGSFGVHRAWRGGSFLCYGMASHSLPRSLGSLTTLLTEDVKLNTQLDHSLVASSCAALP